MTLSSYTVVEWYAATTAWLFAPCRVDYSSTNEILGPERSEEFAKSYDELDERTQNKTHMGDSNPLMTDQANNGSGTNLPTSSKDTQSALTRGTGRAFPTKFVPSLTSSTPSDLFPAGIGHGSSSVVCRFVRQNDLKQVLIYVAGVSLGNGQRNAKAGWAFFYKPETDQPAGIVSARLENQGPFGDGSIQSNNRAELRAAIGALRFRNWPAEGFNSLVIATDSEYVAEGATKWVRNWVNRGWITGSKMGAKNKDLWEALLGEIERRDSQGLKVQFWRIPRATNVTAYRAARQAAESQEDKKEYGDII
ncbi:hypothetical protein FDECE_9339 [Fusarium decemcellulare]|nr:hypothetical protein FDECE_9339 [Fusarium decemcellulare]